MEVINKQVSSMKTLKSNLLRRMMMMDADEAAEYFNAGMANVVDSDLKVIYFMQMDFANIVESLVTNTLLVASDIQRYQNDLILVMAEVKRHKRSLLVKKREVLPPYSLSAYENQMLTLELNILGVNKSAMDENQEDKVEIANLSQASDGVPPLSAAGNDVLQEVGVALPPVSQQCVGGIEHRLSYWCS